MVLRDNAGLTQQFAAWVLLIVCLASPLWNAQPLWAAEPVEVWSQNVAGSDYLIVRAQLPKAQVTLHWQRPDGSAYGDVSPLLLELARPGTKAWMATNAGMYDPGGQPVGLHVQNGKTLKGLVPPRPGSGNFSWLPNGVLVVADGWAKVVESSRYPPLAKSARYASQSGPLLVHRGKLHPGFEAGSRHVNVRNGVGVDRKGRVVFAISQGPVTFHAFAELFRRTLDCRDALYLDGSVSAMATPGQSVRGPHRAGLVGLWAVTSAAKTGKP